ncbi:hypothetical protein M422DRAFT_247830 [Sphaerobolus stellatus SS14]|nr:hypothetical protein M422DRAFT_247830 [Sphaerobolus stellatus SS14]
MAADVEKSVMNELYKTLFTVYTTGFLDNILPIGFKDIETIFAGLKPLHREYSLEAVSCDLKEIVASKGLAKCGAMEGRWVDCHHKSPASPVQVSAIRPDEAFISSEVDPEELARNKIRLEELEKELGGQRRTRSADKLVEFQKLCAYARQILREQLDRRFVIGFTICFDKLNIYLFDRSGVIATNQSNNIHPEPEKFIHAVACFSVLPTEALEWDPTISMFHRNHRAHYASYQSPWKELEAFPPLYTIQWVIQTLGTYLKKLATIVLEVVGYEDYEAGNPEQAQILVVKQSWQRLPLKNNYNLNQVIALENSSLLESDIPPSLPSDGDSQGRPLDNTPYEVYAHSGGSLKDRIHRSGYVKNHNGEIVDTMLTTRKGLMGIPGTIESNIPSKRPIDPADREKFIYEQPSRRHGKNRYSSHRAILDLLLIGKHSHFGGSLSTWALAREGPGKRREARFTDLDRVFEEYFDGSVSRLTKAKTGIFYQYRGDQTTQIGLLEDQLLKNFHPFFEPAKDLIREWWELLRLGFAFKGHEYHNIHKRTLDLPQTML